MGIQFLQGQLLTCLDYCIGHDFFAPGFVGRADDRSLDDRVHDHDLFLNIAWIHVHSAGYDHVFFAIDDGDKTFIVNDHDVTAG